MPESRNRQLRSVMKPGAGVVIPGAGNALGARIIEQTGFPAVYVTGAGIANTFLGMPDVGLTTLSEIADHVRAMRESVELPLIVDADTGFGNPVNVNRTVRVLENAGASAIQLEDQDFPKKCGHFSGKSVIAAQEMAEKIKSAIDARVDPDMMIIARTDALACNGIDDALDRARLYIEAGADMTFVEAPRDVADMERIARELPVPQIINIVSGGLTPALEAQAYKDMGFAMILYANAAMQAAMLAMQKTLAHLHQSGSLKGIEDLLIGFKERQDIVGKPAFDEMENRYSTE